MDWQTLADPWLKNEVAIEVAHRVVLDGLMERANLSAGQAVLDIGCGSGSSVVRVAEAVGSAGLVLGVDISPPMVARASERVPEHAEVVAGDAQTHDFEAHRFDAVISQFGSMFFADTAAAFANIRGAVRPGGQLCLAAWGAPDKNDWFAIGRRVATERLGPGAPQPPGAPGPFAFADAGRVLGILSDAGWQAEVETVDMLMLPVGDPVDIAFLQSAMGAASMVLREKGGGDADRVAINEEMTRAFETLVDQGQVKVPAQIHYFSAVNPG